MSGVTSASQKPGKHRDDSTGQRKIEIIPYPTSQIKIEKVEGKKTASFFCASAKKPVERKTEIIVKKSDCSLAETPTAASNAPEITSNDSDISDALSVVSDVSDLSVMSFSNQSHSLALNPNISRLSTLSLHSNHKSVFPMVHGHSNASSVVSGERFATRRKASRWETEQEYFINQVSKSSSQKSEITKVKEENFQLKRENVNLKSRVESLEKNQLFLSKNFKSEDTAQQLSSGISELKDFDLKVQLRQASEKLFNLGAECDSLKSENKSITQELALTQKKCQKLMTKNAELEHSKAGISAKFNEAEDFKFESKLSISEAEVKIDLLSKDVEGLKKSEQWHKDQLAGAQEMRKNSETEIVRLKNELSAKNEEVVHLKARLEEQSYSIDKEKRVLAQERDEFAIKLKHIEIEMSDQEIQLDQIQKEKDCMISELSQKLNASESDINSFRDLSDSLGALQTDLGLLKIQIEDKEQEICKLKEEKETLCSTGLKLQEDLEILQTNDEAKEGEIKQLTTNLKELQKVVNALKEKESEMQNLAEEKVSVEQSMELLLVELKEQKSAVQITRSREESLQKKIEELEQECLEQHNAFDEASKNHCDLAKQLKEFGIKFQNNDARLEKSNADLSVAKLRNEELSSKLEEKEKKIGILSEELCILSQQIADTPSTQELEAENVELRKKVLTLEQYENQVNELGQQIYELSESKTVLQDKLLESEKIYDEEVDKLRSLVVERDEAIVLMRSELLNVEVDLVKTRHILDTGIADRERVNSEQGRKMDDLQERLKEFETTKHQLSEATNSVRELQDKLRTQQEENDSLVEQLQNALGRSESIETENRKLKNQLEENLDTNEEMKEMHCQRISRLEHFITEYEKEIEELGSSKSQLQNQIISLEMANGKLKSESILNDSLREQVAQLQKDIKSDTALREELVRTIEKAKSGLGNEISNLQTLLTKEREANSKCKESLVNLENENIDLQQDVNSLQLQLNEKHEEMLKWEKKCRQNLLSHESEKDPSVRVMTQAKQIKELDFLLEEKNRSISGLEDRIATLKFHLQQKDSELDELRRLGKVQSDKNESLVERMRREEENSTKELARMVKNIENLAEEKNNYKSQVHQMNLALRNSLEHIKQLRSQASLNPLLEDSALAELLANSKSGSARDSTGRNLSNLQSCLASLKSEMAVLQSKLAPTDGVTNSWLTHQAEEEKNAKSSQQN